jgi:hypothetical protein
MIVTVLPAAGVLSFDNAINLLPKEKVQLRNFYALDRNCNIQIFDDHTSITGTGIA